MYCALPSPLPTTITQLEETNRVYTKEEKGYIASKREIKLGNIRFLWANFSIEEQRDINIVIPNEKIEMHFRLHGRSTMKYGGLDIHMQANEHSLFYQHDTEAQFTLFPGQQNAFFEISLPRPVFDTLVTDDCSFLQHFSSQLQPDTHGFWPGHCLSITAQMHTLIDEMSNTVYTGHMKRLFLEAKMIELFLLQVNDFNQPALPLTLKPYDIECLQQAKHYLDEHYGDHCSIMDLAGHAGINQKKLKQGFKTLFGHTVFGYLSHVRMEKARQLLLDEKKTVGEVAALVGYQYPQHFTAAFRKKYGMLPSLLKN